MAKSKGGGDGANRDVLFRAGIADHPDTKKTLKSLQEQVSRAQQAMVTSAANVGKQVQGQLSRLDRTVVAFRQKWAQDDKRAADTLAKMLKEAQRSQPFLPVVTAFQAGQKATITVSREIAKTIRDDVRQLQGIANDLKRLQGKSGSSGGGGRGSSAFDRGMAAADKQATNDQRAEGLYDQRMRDAQFREQERKAAEKKRSESATIQGLDAMEASAQIVGRHGVSTKQDRRKVLAEMAALERKYQQNKQTEAAKTTAEIRRQLQAEDREAERLHSRHRARQLGRAKGNRDAAVAEKDSQEELAATRKDATQRVEQINRTLGLSAVKAVASVMQLTRGYALLGLAGEKDSEKLLSGLIKVQGGVDVVVGTMKTLRGLVKTWDLYREAVKYAAIAGSTASKVQTAALAQETLAANSATAAHGRLALARAGGGVAGAAGNTAGAAGKLGKVAQYSDEAAAMLELVGRRGAGKVATKGGGLLGRAAGALGLGAGGVTAGGAMVTGGAFAAAAGGVLAGGTAIKDTIQGIGKYGFMGGVEKDSMSDKIGKFFAKLAGRFTGLHTATEKLEKAEQKLALTTEARERREESAEIRLEAEAQTRAIQRQTRDERAGLRNLGRPDDDWAADTSRDLARSMQMRELAGSSLTGRAALGNALGLSRSGRNLRSVNEQIIPAELQRRRFQMDSAFYNAGEDLSAAKAGVRGLGKDATENDRKAAYAELAAANQRLVDLNKENLDIERQIRETKLSAVRQSIEGIQREMDLREQQVQSERQRVMGAKERFGELSPGGQMRALALKRKADMAGQAALTVGDQSVLSGIETSRQFGWKVSDQDLMAEQQIRIKQQAAAARALTPNQRKQLSEVGTGFTEEVRRQGALQSASRAGFDVNFGLGSAGSTESQSIAQAREVQRRLQVELNDKRQIEVEIKRDDRSLVAQIANEVDTLMARRDKALLENVQRELTRRQQDLAQKDNRSAADRKNS